MTKLLVPMLWIMVVIPDVNAAPFTIFISDFIDETVQVTSSNPGALMNVVITNTANDPTGERVTFDVDPLLSPAFLTVNERLTLFLSEPGTTYDPFHPDYTIITDQLSLLESHSSTDTLLHFLFVSSDAPADYFLPPGAFVGPETPTYQPILNIFANNEFVFDIRVKSVPEPATLFLVGSGLVGLGFGKRRRVERGR